MEQTFQMLEKQLKMDDIYFSKDITEFLYLLDTHHVKYLIVGGEAVIYYGHARLTGDIDLFYEQSEENCEKLLTVLNHFWNNDIPGNISKEELMTKNMVFQYGVPPNRIDLISTIENVEFAVAWDNRVTVDLKYNEHQFQVYYIGINELIKNKSGVERYKDKDDLRFLREVVKKKK